MNTFHSNEAIKAACRPLPPRLSMLPVGIGVVARFSDAPPFIAHVAQVGDTLDGAGYVRQWHPAGGGRPSTLSIPRSLIYGIVTDEAARMVEERASDFRSVWS